MKITAIKTYAVDVPMTLPYTTALVDKKISNSVITVIETDNDIAGIGQATTSAPRYAPFEEDQEMIIMAIKQKIAPAIIGADPFDLELLHERMDRVCRGHNYAISTIDLAVHDIMGEATNQPVHKLIGGCWHERIPLVAPHLGIMPAAVMAETAVAFLEQGYKAINIRVGADLRQDVENLSAVREAVGDNIPIAVDFSQALHFHRRRPDEAIRYIRTLENYGLDSIEQPLAGFDFDGMMRVAAAIDSPIIMDEGIRTLDDALRAVKQRAADIIKIKIMKVGGFFLARKIAAICEAGGIPVTIGHGLSGIIQNSAEAHLAFSLKILKPPGEMNGFLRLKDDVAFGELKVVDGDLLPPEKPGIGVTIDYERLKKYSV